MNIKVQETADRLLNRIGVSTCSFTTVKAAKKNIGRRGAPACFPCRNRIGIWSPARPILSHSRIPVCLHFLSAANFWQKRRRRQTRCFAWLRRTRTIPAFISKSNPEVDSKGYGKLNVEVYGGAILNTWMDRALSVAGKVVIKSDNVFEPEVRIVDMKRPLFTIPNLAIHLNREVNKGVELNRQNDLEPLAFVDGTEVEKRVLSFPACERTESIRKRDIEL